jgi:nucleoside-diphosphate-sugar epimerase
MRIFLAGGSGVLGVRLLPLLRSDGHTVAATTRSPVKLAQLRRLGAEPVICDIFDRTALIELVTGFRPELVMHQVTDLPDDPERIPDSAAANGRIRREGTANLLHAARAAGCSRLIAQSVAWQLPGDGGDAVAALERMVTEFGGSVIRYGQFYGPDTYYPQRPPGHPRIHIDAAAQFTVHHLDAEPGSILTAVEA